jgi:hypothetical protein
MPSWPTRALSLPLRDDALPMAAVQSHYVASVKFVGNGGVEIRNGNTDSSTVQWRRRAISVRALAEKLDEELLEQNRSLTQSVHALHAELAALYGQRGDRGEGGLGSGGGPLDGGNDSLFSLSVVGPRATRLPSIGLPSAAGRFGDGGGVDSKVRPRKKPPDEVGAPWRLKGKATKPLSVAAQTEQRLRELAAEALGRQLEASALEGALAAQAADAAALDASLVQLRAAAAALADNRHPAAGLEASRKANKAETQATLRQQQLRAGLAALSACRLQLRAVQQLRRAVKHQAKAQATALGPLRSRSRPRLGKDSQAPGGGDINDSGGEGERSVSGQGEGGGYGASASQTPPSALRALPPAFFGLAGECVPTARGVCALAGGPRAKSPAMQKRPPPPPRAATKAP